MSTTQTRTRVAEALRSVAPEADLEALDPEANFRDQIDVDSVDFLNFVLALEEKLGFRIPETDYPKLSSLNGCVRYLESSRGG